MGFDEVSNRVDFPKQERDILAFWKETDAFNINRAAHKGKPKWSFVDGPITANNPMGVHHGWGRTYKDIMNRYQTMTGHELRYQNGFDCQGLWVEVEVEKDQGFKSKKDIEAYGIANFVNLCKARVLRYAAVQTRQSIRLGYWMDWNDPETLEYLAEKLLEDSNQTLTLNGPHGPVTGTVEWLVGQLGLPQLEGSYFTFSTENNFMIWKFLKRCHDHGWIYRGVDVMPWCPRCATGISQHEIVTDGYSELTHKSVVLRFPLLTSDGAPVIDAQGRRESLLIWTTTPWTLTSNVAAAVGPELTYVKVAQGDEVFYLAKGTMQMLKNEYQVLGELKGADMIGWKYQGPFDELPANNTKGGLTELTELTANIDTNVVHAHQVIPWSEVGEAEGTGIVHIAPGCGAEDFVLGKEFHLPLVAPLDEEGFFLKSGFDWLGGMHVSEVADPIFENLIKKERLYRIISYTHRYPTCWRCKTELVFRLVDEWYINMGEVYDKPDDQVTPEEKEVSLRYQIMDVVGQINWIPAFGYSREMDWLHNMHDWMISKKRYWGLALPIWTCDHCNHFEVIGDELELHERAIEGWETFEGHTPHRPYVDAVKLACPKCGGTMNRIADVGNPWLDAGIVPFSTLSFRADPDYFQKWYPADWISESFPGQFRNWFYSLLVMGTVLSGKPPFMENFSYGTLVAEDGRPMHKSAGNSIEFNTAADKMGVDVMRWLYATCKPELDLHFGFHRGDEVRRQFLIPLWNAYSFFVTYARIDGWQPPADGFDTDHPEGLPPVSDNLLDRWILARTNQVNEKVTEGLEDSDFMTASNGIGVLIDDLTNWYIRRSRRRFWKSEQDTDKGSAYGTLYHVLVKLIRMLAPFTPFVAEVMYQNLVRNVYPDALLSVHQTAWPKPAMDVVDESLLDQMALARDVASLGLAARNAENLKVRQPLAKAMAFAGSRNTLLPELVDIITDELNVKAFEFVHQAGELVNYKLQPNNKLMGPKYGAKFPKVRDAVLALDANEMVARILAGETVPVVVDGETLELPAEEVQILSVPVAGLAVFSDRGIHVAVDAMITPELRDEGLAREVVRRIQDLRKTAGFDISDRIHVRYSASGLLTAAIASNAEYIRREVLAVSLENSAPGLGMQQAEAEFDGEQLLVGVEKAE